MPPPPPAAAAAAGDAPYRTAVSTQEVKKAGTKNSSNPLQLNGPQRMAGITKYEEHHTGQPVTVMQRKGTLGAAAEEAVVDACNRVIPGMQHANPGIEIQVSDKLHVDAAADLTIDIRHEGITLCRVVQVKTKSGSRGCAGVSTNSALAGQRSKVSVRELLRLPCCTLEQAQAAKDRAFTDNDAPLKETPFHAVLVAVRGIDEPQTPEEWLTLPAVLLDWEQVRAAFEMKKCTHLLDAAVLNHSVTICVEDGRLRCVGGVGRTAGLDPEVKAAAETVVGILDSLVSAASLDVLGAVRQLLQTSLDLVTDAATKKQALCECRLIEDKHLDPCSVDCCFFPVTVSAPHKAVTIQAQQEVCRLMQGNAAAAGLQYVSTQTGAPENMLTCVLEVAAAAAANTSDGDSSGDLTGAAADVCARLTQQQLLVCPVGTKLRVAVAVMSLAVGKSRVMFNLHTERGGKLHPVNLNQFDVLVVMMPADRVDAILGGLADGAGVTQAPVCMILDKAAAAPLLAGRICAYVSLTESDMLHADTGELHLGDEVVPRACDMSTAAGRDRFVALLVAAQVQHQPEGAPHGVGPKQLSELLQDVPCGMTRPGVRAVTNRTGYVPGQRAAPKSIYK